MAHERRARPIVGWAPIASAIRSAGAISGSQVLDEIASVNGDAAEDFYACLYGVLKDPRSAPRVLLVKNQPARYMVPFDDALLAYELRPESHQVVLVRVIWDWPPDE